MRISLSGGRVGPTDVGRPRLRHRRPAGLPAGSGTAACRRRSAAGGPAAALPRSRRRGLLPGGACDYSFIFTNGEYETISGRDLAAGRPSSAARPRKQEEDVVDPKAGYVWDATRQDPGTDGWGHYPRSGRAQVYTYPGCKDGRVVADVVRLQKGHTEGLEPNVTDKLIQLAVSAKGGKIKNGSWTPPPPPPPAGSPFGPPRATGRPRGTRLRGDSFRMIRSIVACLALAPCSTSAAAQPIAQPAAPTVAASGANTGTIDVGKTGWANKRPVVAAACPFGCPWGEIGEFVRDAMKPLGYDVILCRNCNRDRGPRLVSGAGIPPPLDALDARTGTTQRFDAPVDFGITAAGILGNAYRGEAGYANGGTVRQPAPDREDRGPDLPSDRGQGLVRHH